MFLFLLTNLNEVSEDVGGLGICHACLVYIAPVMVDYTMADNVFLNRKNLKTVRKVAPDMPKILFTCRLQ